MKNFGEQPSVRSELVGREMIPEIRQTYGNVEKSWKKLARNTPYEQELLSKLLAQFVTPNLKELDDLEKAV